MENKHNIVSKMLSKFNITPAYYISELLSFCYVESHFKTKLKPLRKCPKLLFETIFISAIFKEQNFYINIVTLFMYQREQSILIYLKLVKDQEIQQLLTLQQISALKDLSINTFSKYRIYSNKRPGDGRHFQRGGGIIRVLLMSYFCMIQQGLFICMMQNTTVMIIDELGH